MSELENLRNSKMEEYNEQQQIMQQINQLENDVKGYLNKDAIERYNNLKTAHYEIAVKLLVVLSQMAQSGQLSGQIDDQKLKDILIRLQPKRDFNTIRK